jgi:hypothetical protein
MRWTSSLATASSSTLIPAAREEIELPTILVSFQESYVGHAVELHL